MIFLFRDKPVYIYGLNYKLGSIRRDLDELKANSLVNSTVESLSELGYRYCFGLSGTETLLTLAAGPLSSSLACAGEPRAVIFQHGAAESAVLPWVSSETDIARRNRYFGPALMQQLNIDHVPFFCSFATGCAGFLSLLASAGGVLSSSDAAVDVICAMGDCVPPGVMFDLKKERILGSDHSSAFVVGRDKRGYQLLGLNYYSTTRTQVPLVEVVKRTLEMIQDLASSLALVLSENDVAIHYQNMFPDTWKMVTRYLNIPRVEHVMVGMSEHAHCGGSDSVISLGQLHRCQAGRLHAVVNYGIGLHLGVSILRETDQAIV
jgi:hypothetical protein